MIEEKPMDLCGPPECRARSRGGPNAKETLEKTAWSCLCCPFFELAAELQVPFVVLQLSSELQAHTPGQDRTGDLQRVRLTS